MQASSIIAGYQLVERLDGGGLAEVWRALGPDGRPCALKLVSAADPVAAARFLRERELLQGIAHPRVVQARAAGSTDAWHWLAMDLAPGGSLRERLAQGVPPEELALRWLADALDGLGALHAAGLRHRDLTPANLLLTDEDPPRILVADLGLARRPGTDDRLTATATVVGTPAYLAPERASDRPDARDDGVRADVYALGAVLFHLLTGRAPFTGATPYEVLAKAAGAPRPDPAALRPSVSAQARAMVRCAMAMEPARRYGDAATFAADIRAVLTGGAPTQAGRIRRQAAEASGTTTPSTSAGATPAAPSGPPLRVPWWAIATLGAVALILGVVGGRLLSGPDATAVRDLEHARQTASAAGWRTFLASHPTGSGAAEATNLLALMQRQSAPVETPATGSDPAEVQRLTSLIAAARVRIQVVIAAAAPTTPTPEVTVPISGPFVSGPVVSGPAVSGPAVMTPAVVTPAVATTALRVPTHTVPVVVPAKSTQLVARVMAAPGPVTAIDPRVRDLSSAFNGTLDGANVNPADPDDLLLWSSGGPIRRSLDGGRTWTVTMARTATGGIAAAAWAQRLRATPRTVVIPASAGTADDPGIAWCSTDGGDTWATIAAPWPAAKSVMDLTGLESHGVVLTDGGVMVALRSQIDASGSNAPSEVWRSTTVGRTWSREPRTISGFHTILPVDDGALILYRDGELFSGIDISRDLGRTHVLIEAKAAIAGTSSSMMFVMDPAIWARIGNGAVLLDDQAAEPLLVVGLDGRLRLRAALDPLLRDTNHQLRIEALAINPLDEREWYVAARGLGLLRSSDAGATWKGFRFNRDVQTVTCAGSKGRATLIATGNDTVVIDLGPAAAGAPDLFPLTLAATAIRLPGQGR